MLEVCECILISPIISNQNALFELESVKDEVDVRKKMVCVYYNYSALEASAGTSLLFWV